MIAAYRPDGVGTVTHEEKERFQVIKERLRVLLEHQITNFRYASHDYNLRGRIGNEHCHFHVNELFVGLGCSESCPVRETYVNRKGLRRSVSLYTNC